MSDKISFADKVVGGVFPTNKGRADDLNEIKNSVNGMYDGEATQKAVNFDKDNAPAITQEGSVWWNGAEYTINIKTGLGPTIQVGQETLILFYNDSGVQIDNLSVLHPKSATMQGGIVVPTPELADNRFFQLSEGTLSVATQDIAIGALGLAVVFGRARGGDTSGFTAGAQLWLGTAGQLTNTKPVFPDYSISVGAALNSASSPDGEIIVSFTKTIGDTFNDGWDGCFRESIDFTVDSNGSVITGSLANVDPARDLTMVFSDGFSNLDCTPACEVTLTAGTDTIPQTNYIYIPMSSKVLTVSTSGWPTLEHIKVSQCFLQSATGTQSNGALRNQNWNDHIKKESDNGHLLHLSERLRALNAEWDSGAEVTLSGTTANVFFSNTSGKIYQLHLQTFPVMNMGAGDNIHVLNDPTTPYRTTTNLNDITEYSDGSTWNNEWSNLVVWGICNKSGEPSHLMVNLPSGGYNSEASAVEDASGYSDYTIPKTFKGVGFLLGRFTIRRSSTTFTYNSGVGYLDLRGFFPNNTAGSGGSSGGGVTTFAALTDTPSSYISQAGKIVKVNSGETALEYVSDESITATEAAQGTDNNQTGTAYTLVLTDQELKNVFMNNAAANVVTIPSNSSVAFPVGTKINIVMEGAGQTTITGATGVTVNGVSAGSVDVSAIYQGIVLMKRATDTWIALGVQA